MVRVCMEQTPMNRGESIFLGFLCGSNSSRASLLLCHHCICTILGRIMPSRGTSPSCEGLLFQAQKIFRPTVTFVQYIVDKIAAICCYSDATVGTIQSQKFRMLLKLSLVPSVWMTGQLAKGLLKWTSCLEMCGPPCPGLPLHG